MQLGRYRHFRSGKEYEVVGIARHSESLEELVVYKPLYVNDRDNIVCDFWVRPKKMFFEEVEHEGVRVPRFAFIGV